MTDKNVVVEVPLPDGCMSMHIGRQVERTDRSIILDHAAWVADTGRRHKFFGGEYDGTCEIEPLPDDTRIELPLSGAIITEWAHPLPREPR